MRENERERQRHRQKKKQAPCREPNVGLNHGTPGSHPEPKVDTQPLSHSGTLLSCFISSSSYWFKVIFQGHNWSCGHEVIKGSTLLCRQISEPIAFSIHHLNWVLRAIQDFYDWFLFYLSLNIRLNYINILLPIIDWLAISNLMAIWIPPWK